MASRVLVALRVSASAERAFDVFTQEIGEWWRPNALFRFTGQGPGRLMFEPGRAGRLVTVLATGETFEIGRVRIWEPPSRLVFDWRQEEFDAGQATQVHVHFEPIGSETRITVEHFGWEGIPQEHAARHGFPLQAIQLRQAEWWGMLLRSLQDQLAA